MPKRTLIFFIGLMLPMIVPILADDAPVIKFPARDSFREVSDQWNQTPDIPGRHIQITVTPAELPYPLLKYRLNTYVTEMESGNAAPLYSEAFSILCQQQARSLDPVYRSEEYARAQWPQLFSEERPKGEEGWVATGKLKFKAFPIPSHWSRDSWTEIDAADEERLYNQTLKQFFLLIEKASKKRDCDWGYLVEHKGIFTLLEHIQQTRALARVLQGKANWEIRNGKYDDAVKTIRLGLRLSEHLKASDYPCLVTQLVGIAIRGIMEAEIRLLSAQPDAPNLYPALTQVIEPDNLFQKSLQAEQYWLFTRQNIQEVFEKIDTATNEEYKMLFEEIVSTFMMGANMAGDEGPDNTAVATNLKTMACIACYPYGKARLLKQGFTDEEIESMSVYRVVVPHILEEIKAAYDNLIVSSSFPVGAKHTAIVFDDHDYMNISESPARIYLALLMPAVQAAKNAFLRQEQGLDLLKIVEALRYYAAVHDGQLPESLEAIEELYVPLVNPMDNKPYVYRVEGNTAYIEFSVIHPSGVSRMDVTVE